MKEDVKHRFQRLLRLLDEIKANPGQSAQQLAETFGESKRNLFRDIKLLQESGFDISSEGGYRLGDDDSDGPASALSQPQQGMHPWDVKAASPVEVQIKVEPGLAKFLQTNPLHPSQEIKGDRLTLRVSGPDRIVDWLMSVQSAELVSPSWLRGTVARRAKDLAQRYSGSAK